MFTQDFHLYYPTRSPKALIPNNELLTPMRTCSLNDLNKPTVPPRKEKQKKKEKPWN
jgi:hypothetical protein